MRLESIELPPPKPGEVRVRHEAIGVNFIDTYHRSGLYKLPLPSGIGVEAAGNRRGTRRRRHDARASAIASATAVARWAHTRNRSTCPRRG